MSGNVAYYGEEVKGYSAGTGVSTWRIFYADNTNIYLIADNFITYKDAGVARSNFNNDYYIDLDEVYKKYEGSSWILGQTDGKDNSLAKKWLNEYLNRNPSSTDENIRAVAYLMDTDRWSKYVDENLADYAIGGPTIEMYCKSFKETHTKKYIEYEAESSTNGYRVSFSTYSNWNNNRQFI